MEKIKLFGRGLYAAAVAGVGIQQLCYQNFVDMISPSWPGASVAYSLFAVLCGLGILLVAIAIVTGKRTYELSILLGGLLLLFTVFNQIPFLYIVVPHKKTHLGVWVSVLKCLAVCGGAFVAARSFEDQHKTTTSKNTAFRFLEKLIPLGPVFFSITMISFGCAHYAYAESNSTLVPGWIPSHLFWNYFTGAALIAAGIAIIFEIWTRLAAILLGSMIFIWFWIVHLPNVIQHPPGPNKGNEITAALSALAFSGIAFMIVGICHSTKTRITAGSLPVN